MKLLDAFISLAPVAPSSGPRERFALQNAARLVLSALNEQARFVMPSPRYSSSDRDTAVQTVLFRLIKSGPRGRRVGDPCDDREVKRWLARAIRNASVDEHRRQKRHVEARSHVLDRRARDDHGHGSGGTRRVSNQRFVDAAERARTKLYGVVIPAVVSRKRQTSRAAAERFGANVAALRSAVASGVTVFDLARQSLSDDGVPIADPKLAKRLINTRRAALDKRFQRVREHVLAEIDRQARAGLLQSEERKLLILAVQQTLYLQQREDAVIRRVAREMPSGTH